MVMSGRTWWQQFLREPGGDTVHAGGDFASANLSLPRLKYTVCPSAEAAISWRLWVGVTGLWEGEVGFFTLEAGVGG